jgi:hypothetical protein
MLNAYGVSRLERLKFAKSVASLATAGCKRVCNGLRIAEGPHGRSGRKPGVAWGWREHPPDDWQNALFVVFKKLLSERRCTRLQTAINIYKEISPIVTLALTPSD